MAIVRTDNTHYSGIAAAIRSLHEGEETYTPAEMAEYLSTKGTSLKPWNIAKGVTIFGVTGTLEFDDSQWPPDAPIDEDEVDVTVKKYDVRADITDKFVLMQDDGNITVGYPLKEIDTNMAFYNGHKLPDVGTGATVYIFTRDGEYIYYQLRKGCEAYSYVMWDNDRQIYVLTGSGDSAQHWTRWVLKDGAWESEYSSNILGSSLVNIGGEGIEVIWAGADILAEDMTVLHSAAACTYVQEAKDLFTITSYDEETTEFKARCWLRASYHTTGEHAGQITIDDFVSTESEGWNYIKNIRYCTRDALYFGDEVVWSKNTA